MKNKLLAFIFCLTGTTAFAQDMVATQVALVTKGITNYTDSIFNTKAFFVLDTDTKQFTATINFFPAIPNPDAEDSLAMMGNPLQLKLTGTFPFDNMDFFTTADNGKSATMALQYSLNNASSQKDITFYIAVPVNRPIDDNGYIAAYPGRISFALLINPTDFGLDTPPFDLHKNVLVDIRDAIINKAY